MIGLRSRLAVALLVFGLCLVYALPSVPYIGTALENVLPSKKINLGLDLKGGIHLTLGVDVAKAVSNSLALAGQDIRRLAKDEKIVVLHPRVVGNDKLEFALPRVNDEAKLQEILQKNFPQLNVGEPRRTEAGLRYVAEFRPEEISRIEDMALDQALRTIRNRIDQFGVAEPDIRKQSDNQVQVQLPGMTDAERAIQIIGQTAHLEFHIVRDDVDPSAIMLPAGTARYPLIVKGQYGAQTESTIILDTEALMGGEDITNARPAFNEFGQAYVALEFNSRGANNFERITGEHIKKRMAIVLDGKVYSAPTIQDRIAGGKASITGNFTTEEAQDLAIVLRAGSLPTPVSVLEERTVGPSLGKESINSGIKASLVGAAAVVLVMPLYYGLSGIIADLMLCFTITILLAGMTFFGATLTLPGIAGIVLTIGMSVDANVLIFERIREELKNGMTAMEAVKAGFSRASISIIDSNLTTLITAAILYQFGTGPVRGFAVTLSLGILASMFTAVFVSRAIFESWVSRSASQKISI